MTVRQRRRQRVDRHRVRQAADIARFKSSSQYQAPPARRNLPPLLQLLFSNSLIKHWRKPALEFDDGFIDLCTPYVCRQFHK
jgi:hypothetical protein